MAASDLINLPGLIDNAKCFALVRQHRWPEGACCSVCGSGAAVRDGHDDTQPCRQRYRCETCSGRFDDLTGTVLAGHHQPLRVWVLCLPFMGLNLPNRQIVLELGLDSSDTQAMTEQLRRGLAATTPAVTLEGQVEPDARAPSGIDEVYVVAGHKEGSQRLWLNEPARAPAQAGRRAGPRHAGEGQAAHPTPAWSAAAPRRTTATIRAKFSYSAHQKRR